MARSGLDEVLVVDFGAQYAQLIARRVREAEVYSEIVPHTITAEELWARRPAALILSGGPASVYAEDAPGLDEKIFELDVPILGICYGQQLLAGALGGTVANTGTGEYGRTELEVAEPGVLLADTPATQTVWMSHRDAVTEPPPGFRVTGATAVSPCAVIEHQQARRFGVQFHPEVSHTPHGRSILRRFLFAGAGCRAEWTPRSVTDRLTEAIRAQVGSRPVLCGLSGGVDSAVAAALVHRAVGDQLTCVFVDHGLLRHEEARQVREAFRGHFDVNLLHLEESDRFLAALEGVTDPERKRAVIGEYFIRVFEEAARDLYAERPGTKFLVQGTLYPDVIESGSAAAATIKSHHNVGGLPAELDFELIEPLRDLFKDEVRVIGRQLGLPEAMVWRQPFPGPGLAVRIVGEVTRERCATVRAADRIVLDELRAAGLERDLWQSFAVLLPVRSVGVMGDERTYGHTIVVRAVTSEDGMTADWARMPDVVLETVSARIINEVPGVNRVVYDITSKPPGTIEWE